MPKILNPEVVGLGFHQYHLLKKYGDPPVSAL